MLILTKFWIESGMCIDFYYTESKVCTRQRREMQGKRNECVCEAQVKERCSRRPFLIFTEQSPHMGMVCSAKSAQELPVEWCPGP